MLFITGTWSYGLQKYDVAEQRFYGTGAPRARSLTHGRSSPRFAGVMVARDRAIPLPLARESHIRLPFWNLAMTYTVPPVQIANLYVDTNCRSHEPGRRESAAV